jgi:hypothetical protein
VLPNTIVVILEKNIVENNEVFFGQNYRIDDAAAARVNRGAFIKMLPPRNTGAGA